MPALRAETGKWVHAPNQLDRPRANPGLFSRSIAIGTIDQSVEVSELVVVFNGHDCRTIIPGPKTIDLPITHHDCCRTPRWAGSLIA
jgi:hypothetical protein